MSIRIGNDVKLPDLGNVLNKQFYCPLCPSKMNGVDPRKAMKGFLDSREEFIEMNGEEVFNRFLSIVKKEAKQMSQGTVLEYFILHCPNCPQLIVVKQDRLTQFLLEKSRKNEWSDHSRITLTNQKLQMLK